MMNEFGAHDRWKADFPECNYCRTVESISSSVITVCNQLHLSCDMSHGSSRVLFLYMAMVPQSFAKLGGVLLS